MIAIEEHWHQSLQDWDYKTFYFADGTSESSKDTVPVATASATAASDNVDGSAGTSKVPLDLSTLIPFDKSGSADQKTPNMDIDAMIAATVAEDQPTKKKVKACCKGKLTAIALPLATAKAITASLGKAVDTSGGASEATVPHATVKGTAASIIILDAAAQPPATVSANNIPSAILTTTAAPSVALSTTAASLALPDDVTTPPIMSNTIATATTMPGADSAITTTPPVLSNATFVPPFALDTTATPPVASDITTTPCVMLPAATASPFASDATAASPFALDATADVCQGISSEGHS